MQEPVRITPKFTIIASPGQEFTGHILDALSHRQRTEYESAQRKGLPVNIKGKLVVSFLEVEGDDGKESISLPGAGLVLDNAIRFDAKLNDMEAIREVVDMLTKAYLGSKTVKVRTALDKCLYNYKVAHVSLGDDGTSMKFTTKSPLPDHADTGEQDGRV